MNSQQNETKVQLDIANVCYDVTIGTNRKKLLMDVNLKFTAGEFCAVMGPSGSGKSTLLDLIGNRKLVGSWSGEILVNKTLRPPWFRAMTAYVLQDDVHIANLTVEETLRYSAATKLPDSIPTEEKERRVQELLSIMGLDHVKKTFVGDAMLKGISGGQKKRLSIAVEIIKMPNIIFLDEPTSGLDSSIALEIIGAVRKIVGTTRICLACIHQPSPEVFAIFDRAILMSAGRVIYSGPASMVRTYFESLDFNIPAGMNPAEFLLKVCGDHRLTPEELQSNFETSEFYVKPSAVINPNMRLEEPELSSVLTQSKMLMHRGWTTAYRDVSSLKAEIIKHVYFGLLIGITFFGNAKISPPFLEFKGSANEHPDSELSNYVAIFFFTFIFLWYGNTQHIPSLCAMDQLYRRELAAGGYTPLPYWIAAMLVRIPILLALFTVFIVIFYFMCGFPNQSGYFFYMYIVLFLSGMMSFYTSQGFAAYTGNAQIAYAIVPPLFMVFASFSGYPLILNHLPAWWNSFAPYCSFMRWSYEGLVTNEFNSQGINGTDVNEFYSFTTVHGDFNQYSTIWILLLNLLAAGLLTFWAMQEEQSKIVKMFDFDDGDTVEVVVDNPMAASNRVGHMSTISETESTGGQGKGSGKKPPSTSPSKISRQSSSLKARRSTLTQALVDQGRMSEMVTRLTSVGTVTSIQEPTRASYLSAKDFSRPSERLKSITSKGMSLEFEKLTYIVDDPANKGTDKVLLNELTGTIKAGEMCALMGASGAGKSTLLDVLAGRKTVGRVEGSLLFNGVERSPAISKSLAYVQQDDVHLPMLTVRETLYFAAMLRMPNSPTQEQREERVKAVLEMLALEECADAAVGNQLIRGIPGGQKRRTSMGVEIINFPDLIFLDEPTSGLDSATSEEVICAVKRLSLQNRTVVCTIHQPSATVFSNFDTLLLMAKGRIVYFGDVSDAIRYFTDSPYGFAYVENTNPADFIVAVAGSFVPSKEGLTISGDELADYYATEFSSYAPRMSEAKPRVSILNPTNTAVAETEYPTAPLFQFSVVLYRYYLKFIRSRRPINISMSRVVMMAFMFGTVYMFPPSGQDFSAYKNRYDFCFFSLFFNCIVQMQTIPVYFEDRVMFYRERAAKLYHPLFYWSSTWLLQLAFLVVHTITFSIIAYFLGNFQYVGGRFFFYMLIVYLAASTAYFMCQCIAAGSPNPQTAMGIFPVAVFTNLLFTGFFQYIPNMEPYLKNWIPDLSFIRWSYQALVLNELNENPDLEQAGYYIGLFGFDSISAGGCFAIGLIFFFFYLSLLCFILMRVNFEKR